MNLIISTNLKDSGDLEIFLGNAILCTISDGREDVDFVEDILYGLGYKWNQDGTITPLFD